MSRSLRFKQTQPTFYSGQADPLKRIRFNARQLGDNTFINRVRQEPKIALIGHDDAPALRALPMQAWELAQFKTVKAHIDSPVQFDEHYYSVPHPLIGQQMEVRATQRWVEVLHRGQRVASHARSAHKGKFATVSEHLPEGYRAHLQWNPERLIHWGQDISVATGSLVRRMLEARQHPEHDYQACLALLSLAKRYGKPRLEAACVIALELGTTTSRHVRDILSNGCDQLAPSTTPEWVSPAHANVRGSSASH